MKLKFIIDITLCTACFHSCHVTCFMSGARFLAEEHQSFLIWITLPFVRYFKLYVTFHQWNVLLNYRAYNIQTISHFRKVSFSKNWVKLEARWDSEIVDPPPHTHTQVEVFFLPVYVNIRSLFILSISACLFCFYRYVTESRLHLGCGTW
jgi:hypothetical protein